MICAECGRDIRPCNMARHRLRHEKDIAEELHRFLSWLDIEHHIELAVHGHPIEMVPCPDCMEVKPTGYGVPKHPGCGGLDASKLTPRVIQALGNMDLASEYRTALKKEQAKCENCGGSGRCVGEATWKDELQPWTGRLPDLVRDFVRGERLVFDGRMAEAIRAICEGSIP